MKTNYRIEMDRSSASLTWMIFVNDIYRMDFHGERSQALDKAKQLAAEKQEWDEACEAWLEQEAEDQIYMAHNSVFSWPYGEGSPFPRKTPKAEGRE